MIRTPLNRNRARTALAAVAAAGLALSAAQPALADDPAPEDAPEDAQAEDAQELTKGEKRLAKLLEGRVAGEPRTCIRVMPTDRMTTIEGTAYVYGRGKTIYVQRTRNPDRIDDRDALVSRRFNAAQICQQDVVTTIDPFLGFFTGAVFFDKFVPYTRVDEDADG